MQVFLSSPWLPAEWIGAHGLTPRGVWSLEGLSGEDLGLGAGVCAFANALERWAAAHPEEAFIFSTHCDQLRRGFDSLVETAPSEHWRSRAATDLLVPDRSSSKEEREKRWRQGATGGEGALSRTFLFNLPATWQTAAARQLFSSELERLGRFLLSLGGRPPQSGAMQRLLAASNSARARLLEAAAWCPARAYAAAVARFHSDGSVCLPSAPVRLNSGVVPLALLGGPLPPSHWNLLDSLERAGGRVVL
ncbi:MAG TPA: hypothetical protein VNT26_16970, partial [Candidatus Sulfotelmatobacter sp.]|nr:hypothetical protein [Candidatus Sulfotelmatobacter sp.]